MLSVCQAPCSVFSVLSFAYASCLACENINEYHFVEQVSGFQKDWLSRGTGTPQLVKIGMSVLLAIRMYLSFPIILRT